MASIVSGIGEFHPVRKSGQSVESLICYAIGEALNDAQLNADQIGAVITESSMTPQMAPFDRIAPMAGLNNAQLTLQSTPVGAGILSAVGMAFDLVDSGKIEHALVYFGVDWGTTPNGPTGYHAGMEAKKIVEAPVGFAGPPLYFASAAKRYQYLHGLSDEQLQDLLWDVAGAMRFNAQHNAKAQKNDGLSKDEYLSKKFIAEPLRSVDCSLLSDGAMAIIVSKRQRANSPHAAVELVGWAYDYEPIADMDFYTQSPWLPDLPAARRSSQKAFAAAGIQASDIDAYQVYDCFSIAVILQLEAIGVCEAGQGRLLSAEGGLHFDGKVPTNTHGGLLGHGYILGAGHVIEAIRQLRHQADGRQVANAQTVFVGAGPGRQYTSLIFRRAEQ